MTPSGRTRTSVLINPVGTKLAYDSITASSSAFDIQPGETQEILRLLHIKSALNVFDCYRLILQVVPISALGARALADCAFAGGDCKAVRRAATLRPQLSE